MGKTIEQQAKDMLNNLIPQSEGEEDIFEILFSLEEDEFTPLSTLFLQELKKAYNDPSIQLLITSAMNQEGKSYDDLYIEFQKLIEQLETEEFEDYPSYKIDFLKELISCMLHAIAETQGVTKRIVEIPIEIMEGGIMPNYAHLGDAAVDLYSIDNYDIEPNDTVLVHTGIKVELPTGYALLIQPRSGMSAKSKLRICNTPGLIDSGYRGEICVLIENIEAKIKDMVINEEGKAEGILYGKTYHIDKGERIAQMRLVEVPTIAFLPVSKISDDTERGEGGFGSTGTK